MTAARFCRFGLECPFDRNLSIYLPILVRRKRAEKASATAQVRKTNWIIFFYL